MKTINQTRRLKMKEKITAFVILTMIFSLFLYYKVNPNNSNADLSLNGNSTETYTVINVDENTEEDSRLYFSNLPNYLKGKSTIATFLLFAFKDFIRTWAKCFGPAITVE